MKKIIVAAFFISVISSFVVIPVDYINELQKKINSYNNIYKRTKLDIIFHQPKYSPGDTAYFRAFYTSASDLRLMQGRQIIEIDLFDAQGKRVIKNRALVINGICSSQLILPSKLAPGIYRLIAYSNWMKNFDPALFFRQNIIVSGEKELIKINLNKISFHPEGGKFVAGIENNLVINYFNQDSLTFYSLKNNFGKEITSGKFDKYGYAEIKITPNINEQYSLETINRLKTENFKLPLAEDLGIALQVIQSDGNQQQVKVSFTKEVPTSRYSIAFINSTGLIASVPLKFTKDSSLFIQFPTSIPSGLINVVLINDDLKIMAERLAYKKPPPLQIELIKSKEEFGVRDLVKVQLNIQDENNNPIMGNYSVSVINTDLFKNSKLTTQNNLLLNINPADLNANLNMNDETSINRFLISQDCHWLNWEAILADNVTLPAFKEREYLELEGKLKSAEDKEIPDSTIISLFLEKQAKGYEVVAQNNGVFRFPMILDPWGDDLFFYCTTYKERDLKNIYLQLDQEETLTSREIINFKQTDTPDSYTSFVKEKKTIDKAFGFYFNRQNKNGISEPNALLEEEFGGADLNVQLNDYVVFPTMADVVREILPAVEYRKIKNRDVMRVYTTNKKPGNFSGPLFVIDGHLTKEIQSFMKLDPQYVSSIKVINESSKLLRFGSLCANGVILVTTKYTDIKSLLNEKCVFEFTGINPSVKRKPDEVKINKRIPDLRSCLYWNAHIELDSQGRSAFSFKTSDDVGNYEILIEGISSDGTPFSARSKLSTHY